MASEKGDIDCVSPTGVSRSVVTVSNDAANVPPMRVHHAYRQAARRIRR
jgi:hypothetical protein